MRLGSQAQPGVRGLGHRTGCFSSESLKKQVSPDSVACSGQMLMGVLRIQVSLETWLWGQGARGLDSSGSRETDYKVLFWACFQM